MVTPVLVVLSFLLLGLAIFLVDFLFARHLFNAPRVIHCPGNGRPAAVRLESVRAAIARALGKKPVLDIADCSRWPGAEGCNRSCLAMIEADPDLTLLSSQIKRWRAEAKCSRCTTFVGEDPGWMRIFFLSPNGTLFEWHELPFDWLGEALDRWEPLCEKCASEVPEYVTGRSVV